LQLNISPIQSESYNCIQGIVVSVAKYYGFDYELLFANTWGFGFSPNFSGNVSFGDRVELNWRPSGWGVLERFHGLKLNFKKLENIDEALSIINSQINLNEPVILFIDSFWCPWNPAYKKYHITHYCLAVGIDKSQNVINCIDPYISKNIEKLPIASLAEGYRECITFSISRNTGSDSELLNLLLNTAEYNLGINRDSSAFNLMRNFADELVNKFDKEKEMYGYSDVRFLPLVRKILEIGNSRLNFSETLEYIANKYGFEEIRDFKNRMVQIWKKWRLIRTWLMKAFISDDTSFPIKNLSCLIYDVAGLEEKIAEELHGLLKKNINSISDVSTIKSSQEPIPLVHQDVSNLLSKKSDLNGIFKINSNNENSIALVFKEKTLTYRLLNERSSQLAMTLRNKGIGKNDIVGIMVKRSLEMIIGLLAIVKAGGSYLPIDPDYPEARITYMLDDSKTRVLITQKDLYNKIHFEGEFVDINNDDNYSKDCSNLQVINLPKDLLYIIYTSGSTGNPKGVMIEHKAICNFIKGVTDIIDFSSNNTILALTTISFDIFVLETLLPLAKGLKVVIADENQQRDPKLLSEVIINNNVDMLQITPSRLKILMSSPKNLFCLRSLKVIMIGGEQLPQKLLDELKKVTSARIYNMYGPTETTIWSTIKDLTDCKEVNIGKPIANTRIYIVDNENKAVDVGQEGELCIAGDGLARGYLNRPELTSEKFIQNPFVPTEKMYKTGDVARWLPDGDIDCLGRIDHQVKIRGFRIELGEIENQLSKISGVDDCVVIAKENSYGDKVLVAYYVSDREFTVAEYKSYLGNNLPEYMIPSFYVRLHSLPMTPNGKVDRKALPEPSEDRSYLDLEYTDPKNEVERTMTEIWKNVLKKDIIGTNDNFFEIGGDSLLVVLLHEEIDQHYPGKVEIGDIFGYTTVSKLSNYIIEKVRINNTLNNALNNALVLPEDYFFLDNYNSKKTSLKVNVKDSLLLTLKRISVTLNVEIDDILISFFIYLLSDITGKSEIPLYLMLNNPTIIKPIKIDISKVSELNELILVTNQEINKTSEFHTVGIDMFEERAGKSKNSVIPAVCMQEYLRNNIVDLMDIVLVLNKEREGISITLEYNNFKLNCNKIEEMFIKYAKLLKLASVELKNTNDEGVFV